MPEITRDDVLGTLRGVRVPDLGRDIVSLGLLSEVVIAGGRVVFSIAVDPARAAAFEPVRRAAEEAVRALPGVEQAVVTLTSDREEAPAPRRPAPGSRPPPARAPSPARPLPGVGAIIAVASGKGGVGKSTTSCNLALALRAKGLRVGVLDADIYGPSIPRLLGVTGRPQPVAGRVMRPLEGYGLTVMSMGFMVEEGAPVIWRGPMIMSALTQMLREVAWGELEALVVDMPPGTGDVQLTMAQQVPVAGAVIVSTPQDLALIDARKGLNMFRKADIPVLGIVENMSYFACPHCGTRSDIFGHGGARAEAERLGVPFLGEVPLHMAIREGSDAGRPVMVTDPDGPHARIYREIADRAWSGVAQQAG